MRFEAARVQQDLETISHRFDLPVVNVDLTVGKQVDPNGCVSTPGTPWLTTKNEQNRA